MDNRIKIKEIVRFIVGGGSAVLTDYFIYVILNSRWDISLSKALSYIAGAVVGFIINKLWTFESKRFRFGEIVRYCILYLCSAIVNMLVNVGVLTIWNISILAFLCATGVSTIMNFLGQKFLVFRK